MLAVAGLLVALRVGACPGDLFLSDTSSTCVLTELPSPMTEDAVCSARTDAFECCYVRTPGGTPPYVSNCYATAYSHAATPCGPSLATTEVGEYTYYSMRCPPPPPAAPTTSGEAGDLDGATVGTIVVASLIGVALVGGAVAVHLEV